MIARPAWNASGLRDRWAGPTWFAMTVVGAGFVALTIALTRFHGHDALAYWLVDPARPYELAGPGLTGQGVFRYSPAIAILMGPLGLLPWPVFTTAWLAAQLLVLWRLGGRWWLALVLLPPVCLDLFAGNVDLFLALAVASALRFPGAWALLALTKVTPIVGALWFVGRHDWRGLAWVVGITAALVVGSVLLTGVEPWVQWAQVLGSAAWATPAGIHLPISVLPRVLAAAALAYYAGVTNRAWLVPIAVVLAMPTLWLIALAPLVAVVPELRLRFEGGKQGRPVPAAADAPVSVVKPGSLVPAGGTLAAP